MFENYLSVSHSYMQYVPKSWFDHLSDMLSTLNDLNAILWILPSGFNLKCSIIYI